MIPYGHSGLLAVLFCVLARWDVCALETARTDSVPANRTAFIAEGSNLDERSESFNLPSPVVRATVPSTATLTGVLLWGGNQSAAVRGDTETSSFPMASEITTPKTDDGAHDVNTFEITHSGEHIPTTTLSVGTTQDAVTWSGIWTETSDPTATATTSTEDVTDSTTTTSEIRSAIPTPQSRAPLPQLTVDNLGDFHNFSTDGPLAPMSVFQTNQTNLLMGNRVVTFDADGNVTRTATINTGNAAGQVVAVDSHTLATKEATFLAIAQESSSGPGNVVSVYLVTTENTYSLFTRVQTNSSISAMRLYSDHEGNLMLAMAQRYFHCTANYDSECGLSLIYKICGSGDAEVSDVVETGNATTVKLVDDTKSISLMYSTCETDSNGTQTCRIINHFERPGMAPLNSVQEFSCDPSNAEFFNMYGDSYYLGPSPTCDKHQISLWDNQMNFMNTFNTFEKMPESWFIVDAGYEYCDASLVMAGVGKEGTTYYSLQSPGKNYTELLHDPQMSVGQMWSAGGNIYCVNKSAESLTLFKMSCPKSYIAQTAGTDAPWTMPAQWVADTTTQTTTEDETSRSPSTVFAISETPTTENLDPGDLTVTPDATEVVSVSTEEAMLVYSVTPLPTQQTESTAATTTTTESFEEVGQFRFHLRSAERNSTTTLQINHLPQLFDLQSAFSSILPSKNGTLLVVPPSPATPCYRSGVLIGEEQKINVTNIRRFCNPAVKTLNIKDLHLSKAASQYTSGNIYTASLYQNTLEFVTVIREDAFFEVKPLIGESTYTGVEVRICEGFPTVCVVEETAKKRVPVKAEVRCYRMIKFRWTTMLNFTVPVGSKLHMETSSRSERCIMLVESAGQAAGTGSLQLYRMKSTMKGLLAVPLKQIQTCLDSQVHLLNVQRTLWIAIAIRQADDGSCTKALFEVSDDGTLINRMTVEKLPISMSTSRNLPACGGDLLALQSYDSDRTVDLFTVAKRTHEVAPLSYRSMPTGFGDTLQFAFIENRNFLLIKNGSTALAAEAWCAP